MYPLPIPSTDGVIPMVGGKGLVASGLVVGTITGAITLSKAGTTARAVEFPDAAGVVGIISGTVAEHALVRRAADGSLVTSALSDDGTKVASTRKMSVVDASVNAGADLIEFRGFSGNGKVRADGRGAMYWNLCDGNGTAIGQIIYATPAGRPGISLYGPSSADRTDIRHLSGRGFAFGDGTTDYVSILPAGLKVAGTAPASAPAAGTGEWGGGVLWTAGQILSGSTITSTRLITTSSASDSLSIAGGITFAAATTQFLVTAGNVNSTIRIDFDEVTTAAADITAFRTTDTSGQRRIIIYKGDGTNVRVAEINAADGVVYFFGSTPSASSAAEVSIGNGILDYGTSVRYRGVVRLDADSVFNTSTGYTYYGDESTDGSWRTGRSGDDLVTQRREAGTWVTKATVTA